MSRPRKTADILALSMLIALLVVAFLARSPYSHPVPHRDSGIFLSIGSDILQGKVLYQQTWDNKQPLLYFFNALGLWLGEGSVWGVWGLELVLLAIVFLVAYPLIRAALPPLAAFLVMAIAFLAVFPFMGGNYSEEYSLVFQIGILGVLFGVYLPDRKRFSRSAASVAIGVLWGLVFCIKQTYLDIPVTVLLFMLFLAWIEKDRRVLADILFMGLGFILVNIPVFLYFQAHGALRDYVIAAFLFNLYYSDLSILERISSFLDKIRFVTSHPFFVLAASLWLGTLIIFSVKARRVFLSLMAHPYTKRLALAAALLSFTLFIVPQIRNRSPEIGYLQGMALAAGVILAVFSLYLHLRKPGLNHPVQINADALRAECSLLDWRHPGVAAFLFLGMVDFPLTLLIINIADKSYTHYYVALFPAVILLLAGGLAYVYRILEIPTRQVLVNGLLLATLVTGSFPPLRQVAVSLSDPAGQDARSLTAAYLKSVTTPSDTILVWGWESVIYFLAERGAPTRFALPFALYLDTPYRDEYARLLLAEVQARPPKYIVDLLEARMPLIEGRPPDTCLSGNRLDSPRMVDFLAFVCAHYVYHRRVKTIDIYRLSGDD